MYKIFAFVLKSNKYIRNNHIVLHGFRSNITLSNVLVFVSFLVAKQRSLRLSQV